MASENFWYFIIQKFLSLTPFARVILLHFCPKLFWWTYSLITNVTKFGSSLYVVIYFIGAYFLSQ